MQCALSITSVIDPKGMASPLKAENLVIDENTFDLIKRDPKRYHGYINNKTAHELVGILAHAKLGLNELSSNFIVMHGSDDTICLPSGADMIMTQSKTKDNRKESIILPGRPPKNVLRYR